MKPIIECHWNGNKCLSFGTVGGVCEGDDRIDYLMYCSKCVCFRENQPLVKTLTEGIEKMKKESNPKPDFRKSVREMVKNEYSEDFIDIQLNWLGVRAKDKITGRAGVITSVSFDLY